MAAFNALGTWGAIFLLHQFRGLQVSFGLQGSREPRRVVQWASKVVINFNPQGSREPRQPRAFLSGGIQFISIHKALANLDAHSPE